MAKYLIYGMLLLLVFSPAHSIPDMQETLDANFEKVQSALLSAMDKKTENLLALETKVSAASISQEDKDSINSMISQVVTGLEDFKTEISQAQTSDELIQAMKDANQYISENRQEIMQAQAMLRSSLNTEALGQVENLEEALSAAIKVLEEQCPEQASEIAALEPELEELISMVVDLGELMQSGASQAQINAQMAKVYALAMQLIPEVESLAAQCTGKTIQ